jgi:hypothetical protein
VSHGPSQLPGTEAKQSLLEKEIASSPAAARNDSVFLFRMAGGFVSLTASAGSASPELLVHTIADGTTAFLIILAMTFGLVVPRMCIKPFQRSLAKLNPRGSREHLSVRDI